jgi:hypothetical protein
VRLAPNINCRHDATDKTHQTMKKQMASSNENLQLEADETANVLRVRYVGHVSARSMEAAFLGAGRVLDLVRPGFLVLTDMSRVEPFEKMCVPYIGKLMVLFMENGLGSVVRAVPDPTKDIGFNILGRSIMEPGSASSRLRAWMRQRLISEDEYLNVLADQFNQKSISS